MTAAQPDLEPDGDGDGDAVRVYLSRLLEEMRLAEAAAQAARARVQAASDRARKLAAWGRNAER